MTPFRAGVNQNDLIKLRIENGIDNLLPGVTGWAQINGRDSLGIPEKVDLDFFYLKNKSFYLYIKIIFLTIIKVIMKRDIKN